MTGKSISRRAVLRGLGATLALPLLDAMTPAFAQVKAPVHRFQTFYVPNGMAMEYWTPSTVGRNYELTPILKPLAQFREQMLVLSGLKANWNIAHAGAGGSFLTGVTSGGKNEVDILADVSVDQMLARQLGRQTQLSSLELSMDAPALAGACTVNLSCVYTHTLSWRGQREPLPMEHNPRAVFERLFGDSGSTGQAAREARFSEQTSILEAQWPAEQTRRAGPTSHRWLHGIDTQYRATHPESGRAERCGASRVAAASGCAASV